MNSTVESSNLNLNNLFNVIISAFVYKGNLISSLGQWLGWNLQNAL